MTTSRGWVSEGLWQSPQVVKWGEGHGKGLGKRGVMAITTGGEMGGGGHGKGLGKRGVMAITTGGEMGGGPWQGVGKTRGYGNHHRW